MGSRRCFSCLLPLTLPPLCSVADAEQLVGQVNPVAFQKAAAADDEVLEDLKDHVGQLKKVCRLKAVYCLKDVRRQVSRCATCWGCGTAGDGRAQGAGSRARGGAGGRGGGGGGGNGGTPAVQNL